MEETFGQRLSRIRKEKGLTQEDIAKRIVISPQAVSKWENDVSSPDILVLCSLADILGVSVDELLGREKTNTTASETVDSEVVDDEEKMSDSKPEDSDEETKEEKKHGVHIKDGEDEIIIDSTGVHLKDGDQTIDINGNIEINGDNVHIYDKDGNEYRRHHNWKKKWFWISGGFLFGLALIAYIIMGVIFTDQTIGWKAGWIVLLIPFVITSLWDAIVNRKITEFAYPILVTAVYLGLGFMGGYFGFEGWSFYWFLFLTIPAFYLIGGTIDSKIHRPKVYINE
ncbi:MAG: helix-turn-helix domain-containing protein [Bacilli bacterium]|nr:helix-turn-helix domain-containing protein [Bacilli bacterium]